MIQVIATEFRANFGKYLLMSQLSDIHITKNGKNVAILSSPKNTHTWVEEISGVISSPIKDDKVIKSERLAQKYEGLN